MKFSQRIGVSPVIKELQLNEIDSDLKNGLWNVFNELVLKKTRNDYDHYSLSTPQKVLINHLWHNIFKLPLDNAPKDQPNLLTYLRNYFFQKPWDKIYDLLEESINILSQKGHISSLAELGEAFNIVLEREFAGYRFINGRLSPITNSQEIGALTTAIGTTGAFTSLKGCNIHLHTALEKLSDRNTPDFRNSIKESISAVESLVNSVNGTDSDSLGKALKKIGSSVPIHASLVQGFDKIYGYTSDADGIRHFLTSESNCDFEDAKYMLVSCSAFINYLISKANKAGISFQ